MIKLTWRNIRGRDLHIDHVTNSTADVQMLTECEAQEHNLRGYIQQCSFAGKHFSPGVCADLSHTKDKRKAEKSRWWSEEQVITF